MATSADSSAHGAASAGVKRRDFLYLATGAMGAIGAAVAAWPFIQTMNPAADVLALSSVEVDLAPIAVGQRITVKWRSQPVFIARRTEKEIKQAQDVNLEQLRDPQPDSARVKKPEWLVMIGICTHLGCIPLGQAPTDPRGDWNGWFCPCHGSQYDTSGRIRLGPAPANLAMPDYVFTTDHAVRIG